MATSNPGPSTNSEADAYAAAYRHHATTLRNWLVAYGVGGPVLFLSNEKLQAAIKASGNLEVVGWTFLTGVAIQVALSFIDKYTDWICYQQCLEPTPPVAPTFWQFVATWWVEANTPSILLELLSMVLLGYATVTAFKSVV